MNIVLYIIILIELICKEHKRRITWIEELAIFGEVKYRHSNSLVHLIDPCDLNDEIIEELELIEHTTTLNLSTSFIDFI